MRASHNAHTVRLSIETRMFKKTPDEVRRINRPHIQPHQTIGWVTQRGVKKIPVQGEECHTAMLVQQRNDVSVFHAEPRNVMPDAPERNVPLL